MLNQKCKWLLTLAATFAAVLFPNYLNAQNMSTGVQNSGGTQIGTLYWTERTVNTACHIAGSSTPFTIWIDQSFTFVPNGGSSLSDSTSGGASFVSGSVGAGGCPANGPNPATLQLIFNSGGVSYTVDFYIQYGGSGSAELVGP